MSRVRVASALVAVALAGCGGCRDRSEPAERASSEPPTTGESSAGATQAFDWARCEQALRAAPGLPPNKRATEIIDACPVCGDWAPILGWQTPQKDGGPSRQALEEALGACNAWCDSTAKQRFLGGLDDARARQSRGPWRQLGEICKDAVSAVPDARFVSAPYFALDRIARDVANREGGAQLLAAIEIPLPAVTVSGVGPELPVSPLARPELLAGQLTITTADVSVGPVPIARLGAQGITVAGAPYPGRSVSLDEVVPALAELGPGSIGVFAPEALPAARLVEVIAAADGHPLVLAVRTRRGPPGWKMYGTVPVRLGTKSEPRSVTLEVTATPDDAIRAIKAADLAALKAAPVRLSLSTEATVASVATVLGALAFREVPAAALVPARSPRRSR